MAELAIAHMVPVTAAEGPHERFAIWLQGCSIRCPGCCNPELFAAGGGRVTVEVVAAQIVAAGVEGLTLLGGEPLDQIVGVTELCARVSGAGLGVIVFSGHALDEARALDGFAALWPWIDTLVDGPFVASRPEPSPSRGGRRWLGSTNQTICHRSDRYADPALWTGPNHAEVRIDPAGALAIHGAPGLAGRWLRGLRAPVVS